MALRMPPLGPRARTIARYAGYAVLGLVTFVFAFQATFPFERVKDRIVDALSDKYEVSIGEVERGILPGRMYFKAVSLRTRVAKSDDVPTTMYIEQLQVDLGLLALLRSTASVKLDAKIGPGRIKGKIAVGKDGTEVDVIGDEVPSASLPMREALGLPMSGKLRFVVELDLPNEKNKAGKLATNWAKAEGHIELACPSGCTVGDGKSKLKPKLKNQRSQAFAEGGIDFGKVSVDSLVADVDIKNGKLGITRFDTKSSDGELRVDFEATLNQDVNQSLVTGCLRFKGSDGLLKREPKTHAAISTTGAPLGPDNLFHIKLDGPLRDVRRIGAVCGAAANTSMDNPGGGPARPNLTVTPETPAHPTAPPPIPQPSQPIVPPTSAPTPPSAGSADIHAMPPVEGEVVTPPGNPAPGGPPPNVPPGIAGGSQQQVQPPPPLSVPAAGEPHEPPPAQR